MPAKLTRLTDKLMVLAPLLAAAFSCAIFAGSAHAQAAAEAAGSTSIAAGAASSIKPVPFPKFPDTGAGRAGSGGAAGSPNGNSPHLIASSGPPPEDTNRKMLEARAGKDASKLLLRATPVEAQIWVDGKIVGRTPLLMVLAPGKYQVEMRGARGQTGKSSVALLPRETRELAIKLDALYPARVTVAR